MYLKIKIQQITCGLILVIFLGFANFSCGSRVANSNESFNENVTPSNVTAPISEPDFSQPTPEIVQDVAETTDSPLGKIDFKNFTFPMPRGWQSTEDKDVTLVNGTRPIGKTKIGVGYVKTRFFDLTGDGKDDAIVILRIGTGGLSQSQIVYIYTLVSNQPKLIWYFRTGDRADAGLKNLSADNGLFSIELFGQDRYIFGEVETLKIPGDDVDICCPTHFTQTKYKWTGRNFQMQGKRLTYLIDDVNAPPVENKGDLVLQKDREERGKK
jgi:hypothetical protein